MERPDEKQPATSTSPETSVPAASSVVTAARPTANIGRECSDSTTAAERSAPLHSLRGEIRIWTRDLLIAIGLALVIIVFLYPLDHSKSFIKRVVGLPGETVEIRQGTVYVDGRIVPEPYVPPQYEDLSDFGPKHVDKDSYFVMGDHRISSNDSRVFGPVPIQYIYGRAVFAYWPVDHFGSLSTTEADTK